MREEVANQLAIASNSLPTSKKLVASLRSALKTIDVTKPTLVNGSVALGTLTKNLGRTTLSNTFLPILSDVRNTYADALDLEVDALNTRLADTIPGKARLSAQAATDALRATIDDSRDNPDFTLALRSLSKAAKALAKAQKAVAKAESAPPGANFMTATVTESNQGTTTLTAAQGFVTATYDSFTGEFMVDGGEARNLGGGRFQGRVITLAANLESAGTYTLSLTNFAEGYGYYERAVATGINLPEPIQEFYELYPTVDPQNDRVGTGIMTLTLDLTANVVWGEFTFTATGNSDANLTVSITGTFFARLESF